MLICAFPKPLLAQSGTPLRIPRHIGPVPIASLQPIKTTTQPSGRDSLKNGAIIGAVVLGTWCAIICGQGLDNPGKLPLAVIVAAGEGAAIGAGIDAMLSRKTGIYFRKRW
jgi:outer membrane lipoprotein SlyB